MGANGTEDFSSNTTCPPPAQDPVRNYAALALGIFLILFIISGNLLVCLSVCTEKALKTTTNYFIVSLAVADLLLAILVLPLYVYSEVKSPQGTLLTSSNSTDDYDAIVVFFLLRGESFLSGSRYIFMSVYLGFQGARFGPGWMQL